MTIERAIRLATKWEQGYLNTLREGELEEFYKLVLELLLKEKKRQDNRIKRENRKRKVKENDD